MNAKTRQKAIRVIDDRLVEIYGEPDSDTILANLTDHVFSTMVETLAVGHVLVIRDKDGLPWKLGALRGEAP